MAAARACSRRKRAASPKLKQLKGKTIGISDLAAPARTSSRSCSTRKASIRSRTSNGGSIPGELLPLAPKKGEIHAIADGDPKAYSGCRIRKLRPDRVQSRRGFENRVCCIVGLRGSLIRDDRRRDRARPALLEAQDWVAKPEEPRRLPAARAEGRPSSSWRRAARSQTHDHNPAGADLREEIALYAQELRDVAVFKKSTDPQEFADRVYADVLTA